MSLIRLVRQYQGYVPIPVVHDTDDDVRSLPHDESEVEELLDDQDNQVKLYRHFMFKIRQLFLFS